MAYVSQNLQKQRYTISQMEEYKVILCSIQWFSASK